MKKLVLVAALAASTFSFSQMTLHGTANQMGGCDTYQLTPNVANVAGAAWSSAPIDLSNDFDMIFEVYLGTADVWAADGMAFVLQQNGTGLGSLGSPLGYGIPYSSPAPSAANMAIEIDLWANGPVPGEIPQDHVGISSNGGNGHDIHPATQFPGGQEVADGAWHEFRVQWISGFNALAVYWEGAAIPIISMTYDITNNIFSGNPIVYWGFTAGTGGAFSEFRVRAVGNPSFTTDATSVCPGVPIQFTDASTTPIGNISSWSWDFGDGSPLNTTQNPSYAYSAPGSYTATLTMSDGFCSYPVSTGITILDSLSLSMTATDVTCFGDTDGTVMGSPTTGVAPYGWSWNDTGTQTTETATALPPGMYTVTVTDNDGCVGIDSVEVLEPLQLLLAMDSMNVVCNSDSTGEATVSTTNGVAPFSYAWDDFMSQTAATANGLPAGTYTVIVTDADGCTATDSVSITENPAIVLSATSTPDNGTNNGTIDLTATGGSGPLTYLWDTSETTEDLTGVGSGAHTVTVTDSLGCSEVLVVNVASSVGFLTLADIGFNVFPNPSNGAFTIVGSGDYHVFVRDLRGRVVLSNTLSETSNIELQDVQSGVYLLTIVKDNAEYMEKLIIK